MSVRLPSAVAGVLLVIVTGIIVRRWLQFSWVAVIFSLLAATFCPFMIFYSRLAFEANVALLFFVSGWLAYVFSWKAEGKHFYQVLGWYGVALGCWALACLTYNTPLLLLPCVISVSVLFRLLPSREWTLFKAVGVAALVVVGMLLLLPTTLQKKSITIFGDEAVRTRADAYRQSFTQPTLQKILGHKVVFYFSVVVQQYLAEFSPVFLVRQGGSHPWHNLPGFGHLGWGVYGLAMGGIVLFLSAEAFAPFRKVVFRDANMQTQAELLFFLTILAPLPAAVTVDAPHATRSLWFFWLLLIWASWSVEVLASWLRSLRKKTLAYGVATVIFAFVLVEGLLYYTQYLTFFKAHNPGVMVGLEQALQAEGVERSRWGVPPTDVIGLIDPSGYLYIQVAWYQRLSPDIFWQTLKRQQPDKIGFSYGEKVGMFHFFARERDGDKKVRLQLLFENEAWAWRPPPGQG
jgi:hypothetical protein